MDENTVKRQLKQSLLLSAGLFILGKKKVGEFVKSLEENGLTKEEAENTARDVIKEAKNYKENFVKRIYDEIEAKNVFATKDDVKKIEKTLKEISSKIDSEE